MLKSQVKAWKPTQQELDELNKVIDLNIEYLQPTYEVFGKLEAGG